MKRLCKKANVKLKAFAQVVIYGISKKEIKNEFLFCITVHLMIANMDDPRLLYQQQS